MPKKRDFKSDNAAVRQRLADLIHSKQPDSDGYVDITDDEYNDFARAVNEARGREILPLVPVPKPLRDDDYSPEAVDRTVRHPDFTLSIPDPYKTHPVVDDLVDDLPDEVISEVGKQYLAALLHEGALVEREKVSKAMDAATENGVELEKGLINSYLERRADRAEERFPERALALRSAAREIRQGLHRIPVQQPQPNPELWR